MALYKYANVLTQHKAGGFDVQMKPEHHVPASGIYRCAGCGGEIAIEGFCFPTKVITPTARARARYCGSWSSPRRRARAGAEVRATIYLSRPASGRVPAP